MYLSYYAFITVLVNSFTDAFFLLEKPEPVLFCIKVCPLYCSPRKRRDVGGPPVYWDEPPFWSDDHIVEEFRPLSHDPYYFCKPHKKTTTTTTTTTTTMAPTTEEPTWICMVCMNKCNYPRKT